MNDRFKVGDRPCEFCLDSYRRNSAHMLPVTDWLADVPGNTDCTDLVEVQVTVEEGHPRYCRG